MSQSDPVLQVFPLTHFLAHLPPQSASPSFESLMLLKQDTHILLSPQQQQKPRQDMKEFGSNGMKPGWTPVFNNQYVFF